jgi:hypothetical protein
VIREHYRLAEELYGERYCGPLMRKFGIKYSALHPQHEQVRTAFIKIRSRQDWEAALDRWYGEDLPGNCPAGAVEGCQTGAFGE